MELISNVELQNFVAEIAGIVILVMTIGGILYLLAKNHWSVREVWKLL